MRQGLRLWTNFNEGFHYENIFKHQTRTKSSSIRYICINILYPSSTITTNNVIVDSIMWGHIGVRIWNVECR